MIARLRARNSLRESALALAAFAVSSAALASGTNPAEHPEVPDVDSAHVGAQGSGFVVTRQVIAGGGGSSAGGVFRVDGTIGQPDADPLHPTTGGVYAIIGGFWPGLTNATPGTGTIFANGFE
jgi:hypothetical protein